MVGGPGPFTASFLFLEKQTRSVERHIRKMEFHISKVSGPCRAAGWGRGSLGLAGPPLG